MMSHSMLTEFMIQDESQFVGMDTIDMTNAEKEFLHIKDGQKDWVDRRLESCPLSKLQCKTKENQK